MPKRKKVPPSWTQRFSRCGTDVRHCYGEKYLCVHSTDLSTHRLTGLKLPV
jgi:hypothetical protein